MTRGQISLAFLAATLLVASPGRAQIRPEVGGYGEVTPGEPQLGSRLAQRPDERAVFAQGEAVGSGYGLAACYVRNHERASKTFMSRPYGDKATWGLITGQLSNCLGAEGTHKASLSFSETMLRGMIAEALLKQERLPTLPAAPAVAMSYSAPWMTGDPARLVVAEMAACVVDTDPERAELLVSTQPGSGQSAQALSAVMPSVGKCLVKGTTLKTNALGMRAAIAEALYHRVADGASATPAASGTASKEVR